MIVKILKWTEIIGACFFVGAVVFKVLHLAGAPQLLLIGLLTLATTYFLSAKLVISQNQAAGKELGDVLVGIVRKIMLIGISVFCVGYLFTLLHLKGANEMIIIGFGTILLTLTVSMILVLLKRERMNALLYPMTRSIAMVLIYLITPLLR